MTEERKCPFCPGVKYPGGCPPCAEFLEGHETLIARAKELEAENERLKSIDHFTPIEAAGAFAKSMMKTHLEKNGVSVNGDDIGIEYICSHCGQRSRSKEEMITHDAECFRHPAVIKATQLQSELAQAKAKLERYEWEWDNDNFDDRPLPEDESINATHPCKNPGSGYGVFDMEAMRLVGAKKSKRGLVDLVRWLLVGLTQARAAAVQWVTYTGEPETLPEKGELVLIHDGVATLSDQSRHNSLVWDFDDRAAVKVKPGDRWAYLPTPGSEGGF